MSETDSNRITRLEVQFEFIARELAEAKASRKIQYEKLEEVSETLLMADSRLKIVEGSLAQSAPTIEEFITIKHKVQGAGFMGKWIWAMLAAIIGFLYGARNEIFAWFHR